MALWPVVAYVEYEGDDSLQGNPRKDALIYHLKNTCQCEVYRYSGEHAFCEDLDRIQQAYANGRLLAVIVGEDEYNSKEPAKIIRHTRKLSGTLPIVVIPAKRNEDAKDIQGAENVYQCFYAEQQILPLITSWRKNYQPPPNLFGINTKADIQRVVGQLQHAYQTHYLDGNELGTPDHHDQVVAEALRLRLLPAESLKQEFDSTLREEVAPLIKSEQAVFEEERRLAQQRCIEEQEEFCAFLKLQRGKTSGGSQGDRVEGFAIDSVTLEYCRTRGFGLHEAAEIHLEVRLGMIEQLRPGYECSEQFSDEQTRRIVSAIFYPQVDGFTVPFALFAPYELEGDAGRRIGEFLIRERIAIPLVVDRNENYELRVWEPSPER